MRITRLSIGGALAAACGLLAASAGVAQTRAVPYRPSLAVSSGSRIAASDTRLHISTAFGAPKTAELALWVPAAYGAQLGQPIGTRLGTINGFNDDRGTTPPFVGSIVVADPKTTTNACDTAAHDAVWLVTLADLQQSFSFPIFVHAQAKQPTELHWCLPKDAPAIANLAVDLNGVFTEPSTGKLLWDARFAPYTASGTVDDAGQVAALALVRLPQRVRLRVAHHVRGSRTYTLTGKVTEAGIPVRAAVILSQSVAGRPFGSSGTGVIAANANGVFTVTGRLRSSLPVRFRAHVVADGRDISKPSCGKDVNGVPCVHETLALWEGDSNVVGLRP